MDPTFDVNLTLPRLKNTDNSEEGGAAVFGAPFGTEMLPLEILEAIINVVDDRQDLMSCALACTYFRRRCQSKLFRDFRIRCDYDTTTFEEGGLVHAVTTNDSQTNVGSFIRWLKIENEYGVSRIRGGARAVDHMLGQFVQKLNAVEKLEFRGAGFDWGHGELAEGLITALQRPTLKGLKLASLEGFPMPIIVWGRWLRRIEIERVMFMQTGPSTGSRKPLSSPSLEELNMDNRGMGLSLLRRHILSCTVGQPMLTNLRRLRLEYRDSEGDRPDDINRLLTACQSSLEDLVLFLTHDGALEVYLF
ncbi:hypothetical protein AN958_01705 [Leucoagaricus sp. SymC.cos]|nr:hypothetical protein AN958_01705 [Leucoagaricus sp. SymC.cos]